MLRFHRLRMMATVACLALSAALAPRVLHAQGPSTGAQRRFAGSWQGTLHVSGAALRLGFSFAADSAGGWVGTLTSIDQGGVTLPVAVRVSGDSVHAESAPAQIAFAGRLVTADSIDGTWTQGGAPLPLALGRVAATAAAPRPQAPPAALSEAQRRFVGNWQGTLRVSALALRLGFSFTADSAGGLAGTLTSIDQGGVKLPVTVRVDGDSIRAESAPARAVFAGRLVTADSIDGTWTQGGASLPLALARVATITTAHRPQDPRPPFPYAQHEVSFESVPGVRLAGTLTVPPGAGPFPAVVLVSGSGPQDRDEALLGHRPFAVLADHLTRSGIAVLRYDDRGVGRSTGSFAAATSADFADDAAAAVRFLRTRPEVAPRKIGIAGHSEGGLIAPMVAVRSADVAFIVLLAGPGIPGDSLLRLQGRLIGQAVGTAPDVLERSGRAQARMFAAITAGGDSAALVARLRAIGQEMLAGLTDEQRRATQLTPAAMETNIGMMSSRWFRYFLVTDPRPTLRRVRVPVLALNGSHDLQVPPREDLSAIEAALREGGNRDFRTVELPGLNHLFQTSTTGSPAEYARIEETMSPAALNAISTWILQRFGPGR